MILEPCSVVVDRIVDLALEEDRGSGDLTTEACIDADARAVAHAVARGPVVVCGGSVFARVFLRVDATLVVESHVADGAKVEKGTKLWTVRGKARGTTEQMAEAVRRAGGKALLEASGGMTPARIPEIAKAGVDAISVGAPLTHSATAADIGLDFE